MADTKRVYEIAKELGMPSKELVSLLKKHKFDVSSHMSVLSVEEAKKALKLLSSKPEPAPKKVTKKTVKKESKPVSTQSTSSSVAKKPSLTSPKKVAEKSPHMQTTVKQTTKPPLAKNQPASTAKKTAKKGKKPSRKKNFQKNRYRFRAPVEAEPVTEITADKSLPLFEVAELMGKSSGELILSLLKTGMVCNRNHILPIETIVELGVQYGIKVTIEKGAVVPKEVKAMRKEGGDVRWPIVVVMGHVDHGKTTFLDYIRSMNVAAREKGGITQHINAYEADSKHGKIVFLDTPGHEAFSYLRKHGAKVTDIAIIMVAADDGIMPQTIEAINHAKAAGVEMIVAVNKVDKAPAAAVESVKRQLAEHDMLVEDWGGSTICMPISAKTGQGVNELLEMIVLQAEMLELKAHANNPAKAFILESRLEKGYGPVSSVVCLEGTLKVGDYFVCGKTTGKVRLLIDTFGKKIQQAGPSTPVQVVGFSEFAASGDWLQVVTQSEYTKAKSGRFDVLTVSPAAQHEVVFGQQETTRSINLVIKTDTRGSIQALTGLISKLGKLSKEVECPIKIVSTGVGGISEGDVELASNTGSMLLGFHVKAEKNALSLARDKHVDLKIYHIIYKLIEYLEELLESKRVKKSVWKKTGEAVVRKVFPLKNGAIAGCYLSDGVCSRASKVACVRGGKVIGEGKITSLQRDRKVVKEVHSGYEFGFLTDNFHDWQEDDVVHCFQEAKE